MISVSRSNRGETNDADEGERRRPARTERETSPSNAQKLIQQRAHYFVPSRKDIEEQSFSLDARRSARPDFPEELAELRGALNYLIPIRDGSVRRES